MLWIELVQEIHLCLDEGFWMPRVYMNASLDLETCVVHQNL